MYIHAVLQLNQQSLREFKKRRELSRLLGWDYPKTTNGTRHLAPLDPFEKLHI